MSVMSALTDVVPAAGRRGAADRPGHVRASGPSPLLAQAARARRAAASRPSESTAPGGEVNLVLPDLGSVDVGGYNGRTLLMVGLVVSALGILFGLVILKQLKNLPVHRSMREISELIYETCKTYLLTQGKFIAILEIFIAAIIVLYFGVLIGLGAAARRHHPALQRRSAFSAATAWRGSASG